MPRHAVLGPQEQRRVPVMRPEPIPQVSPPWRDLPILVALRGDGMAPSILRAPKSSMRTYRIGEELLLQHRCLDAIIPTGCLGGAENNGIYFVKVVIYQITGMKWEVCGCLLEIFG
jgi:hypothetical protein